MMYLLEGEELEKVNEKRKKALSHKGTVFTSQYLVDGESKTYCRVITDVWDQDGKREYQYAELDATSKNFMRYGRCVYGDLGCVNIISEPHDRSARFLRDRLGWKPLTEEQKRENLEYNLTQLGR
jgi:hypothetical protein